MRWVHPLEEVPGSQRHEYTSLLGPSRLFDVITHVAPLGPIIWAWYCQGGDSIYNRPQSYQRLVRPTDWTGRWRLTPGKLVRVLLNKRWKLCCDGNIYVSALKPELRFYPISA